MCFDAVPLHARRGCPRPIVTSREGGAALATPWADRPAPEPAPRRLTAPAPQPVLIDAAGHTCLAWWHAPAAVASSALPLAVVLASSWGEEDMAAYDAQRALAIALADGGLGTLRFEWPDTGDSSAPTGSTTIADALAAFDAAAARALALSGHERLAFVGMRLGALLATHAASARSDVDALVALMPVAGGRAFVREQRQLGADRVSLRPGTLFDPAELPVSLGGFALPVRRLEALAALRWPIAATTSVLEALLIEPPQTAGRAASDALARMGMRVRERAHDDPSGAPARAEVVRWLRERATDATVLRGVPAVEGFGVADPANARTHAALAKTRLDVATAAVLALARAEAPVWMRLRERGVALRERVVRIADAGEPALVGVLGERDRADRDAPPREAIVLLSSGRERRVGPHRLWVPWARRRAALGDVVLRLDVAGIGDSARRTLRDPDGTPELYDARCVDDVARAAAWLRREHGVGHCTVMGVCSGAFHAWRAALAGVDVQQVVPINPLTFHWRKGMSLDPRSQAFGQIAIAANAGRSLLDPQRWWKLLSGRANVGVITGAIAARLRHSVRLKGRDIARSLGWRLVDDLAAELAQATARGVAVTFVFSRGEPGLKLLREESGRRGLRLINDSLVKVCEVEHADHTFAGVPGRLDLYARLDSLLLTPPVKTSVTAPAPSHRPALRRS